MSHIYETEEAVLIADKTDELPVLMLFNDDVNTFDHVIDSLIEICGHEPSQAEQCALLVHTKGKCDIKRGNLNRLEKMCVSLLNRGLSAKIIQ